MDLEKRLLDTKIFPGIKERFKITHEDWNVESHSAESYGIILVDEFERLGIKDSFRTIQSAQIFKHIAKKIQEIYELRFKNELYGVNRSSSGDFEDEDQMVIRVNLRKTNTNGQYLLETSFENVDRKGSLIYQGYLRPKCRPLCATSPRSVTYNGKSWFAGDTFNFFVINREKRNRRSETLPQEIYLERMISDVLLTQGAQRQMSSIEQFGFEINHVIPKEIEEMNITTSTTEITEIGNEESLFKYSFKVKPRFKDKTKGLPFDVTGVAKFSETPKEIYLPGFHTD